MANTGVDAVIATRQFRVFTKAFAAANALPADTVLWGTTPAGYVDIGYTDGGLNLAVETSRNEIRVDQEFFPVANPITEVSATIGTELAEINAANLKTATGLGAITTVAPGAGTRGHDDWDLTSDFSDSFVTVLARVQAPDGEIFQAALWRAIPTGTVQLGITPDDNGTIAVEWTGLVDDSTSPGRIMTVRDVIPAV